MADSRRGSFDFRAGVRRWHAGAERLSRVGAAGSESAGSIRTARKPAPDQRRSEDEGATDIRRYSAAIAESAQRIRATRQRHSSADRSKVAAGTNSGPVAAVSADAK